MGARDSQTHKWLNLSGIDTLVQEAELDSRPSEKKTGKQSII